MSTLVINASQATKRRDDDVEAEADSGTAGRGMSYATEGAIAVLIVGGIVPTVFLDCCLPTWLLACCERRQRDHAKREVCSGCRVARAGGANERIHMRAAPRINFVLLGGGGADGNTYNFAADDEQAGESCRHPRTHEEVSVHHLSSTFNSGMNRQPRGV